MNFFLFFFFLFHTHQKSENTHTFYHSLFHWKDDWNLPYGKVSFYDQHQIKMHMSSLISNSMTMMTQKKYTRRKLIYGIYIFTRELLATLLKRCYVLKWRRSPAVHCSYMYQFPCWVFKRRPFAFKNSFWKLYLMVWINLMLRYVCFHFSVNVLRCACVRVA